MAHTTSCSNATTRECRCGGCAGSLHGWPGMLLLAQPAMVGARASSHLASEQEWGDATRSGFRRLTLRKGRAAVDGAKDDIAKWLSAGALAEPPFTVPAVTNQLIEAIGNLVSTDVFDVLCETLGPNNRSEVRAELAKNHLLCSLLAEIAHVMQQLRDELDQAIKQIAVAMLSYYIKRKHITIPSIIANAVAEAAVKGIDGLIATLPVARNFDDLQRAVRILAVLMCPAPEKHEAVVRWCLEPLGEPIVSQLVQERLKAAMPGWMTDPPTPRNWGR